MRLKRNLQDILIRRLSAANQDNICDHFLRLDVRSRRARFCGTVNDDGMLEYAQNIFGGDSIVCGAFVDGRLRGVVELRGVFQSWPSKAEAAISVEPDWQNNGIGDALFERIFAMAQNRGVRTIQMTCLKENSRVRHLAAKHHALLRSNHDAVDAVLHSYWPKLASVMKEVVGETRGYTHELFERSSRSGEL
ncbi:GNAT family N-acetyltransferase [Pseudohalocynthiibacter aestuariivivens]|uniref:GNAT family N-acetyltransferase n=1 Tax=Pseudohalocynthiibacter aestuariivivens TaxID=1591409 RepID=A0ABV5JEK0_9RHOB|nr:GNAT family N-acetyltransferase [Pseudohalocynthiibacter aestuariivivens]MBS9718914.1 GNAT family N-acetyltransferase [Pseudohalocynthiibacter aestuariivivens]